MVHDLEARRAADVIDGGDVHGQVEAQRRIVTHEAADLDEPSRATLA